MAMRTKATKAYKANAATECLHSGMVEPKLRTPKASTCQVLSALPSVEDDFCRNFILDGAVRLTESTKKSSRKFSGALQYPEVFG